MPSEFDNHLLREAVSYLRAKEYEPARRYLLRALELADDFDTREHANFYMSQLTDDPVEKRKYLDETLAINPHHGEARKMLAILDGKLKADEIVDANHLPAQSTETQNAKADRFTCPKCGSRMVFDGDGRSLVCESCARQEALTRKAQGQEQDFVVAMATGQGQRAPVAMKTFKCQGCGAQFMLPPEVIAETCSYCGSVYVLAGTRELVEPDSIIPMAFNQHAAAAHLVEWAEKHKIKPQGKVHAPRGLYLPVWTFDMLGSMPWRGVIYENKRSIPVSSEKMVTADDMVIFSTPKLADLLPKIIGSFRMKEGVPYDPRYMAGWPAEIYQKTLADASLDARKRTVDQLRHDIRSENSHVSELTFSAGNISVLSFKLVLIPLWFTEYTLEDHPHRVIINGQTGTVYGERPSRGIIGWLEDTLSGE